MAISHGRIYSLDNLSIKHLVVAFHFDDQHTLSAEGFEFMAMTGTLASGFGLLNSIELHFPFKVLLKQFSFFGEAKVASSFLPLCFGLRFFTPASCVTTGASGFSASPRVLRQASVGEACFAALAAM